MIKMNENQDQNSICLPPGPDSLITDFMQQFQSLSANTRYPQIGTIFPPFVLKKKKKKKATSFLCNLAPFQASEFYAAFGWYFVPLQNLIPPFYPMLLFSTGGVGWEWESGHQA